MNNDRQNKKIHTTSFLKYFLLKIPSTELSDVYIETLLKLWGRKKNQEKDIEKVFCALQKRNKLLELLEKLRTIFLPRISKKVAISLINIIYKNPNQFSEKGTENFWNSEYDKAQSLLMWLINNKIEKKNIQNMLNEVIDKTPDFNFALIIVHLCEKTAGGFSQIYESIKIDKLRSRLASRLKKYFVHEKHNIFEELKERKKWALVLFQWATNWETFTDDNRKTVNDYIFSIIKKDIKRFLEFLAAQKKTRFGGEWTFNLDESKRAYDLVKLYRLAEKFKDNNSLSVDEKKLIEVFLELYKKKSKGKI